MAFNYQKKNILLLGAKGQLGAELSLLFKQNQDLFETLELSSKDLNILDSKAVDTFLKNLPTIDIIINGIAYTDTAKAEKEPELATLVNAKALEPFLDYAFYTDALFVQISSDFVFNGKKKTPYLETDGAEPINTYGFSKLIAEIMIQNKLSKYFIFRTSSLFGINHKRKNFIEKILEKSKTGEPLRIVNDNEMSPTHTYDLAQTILFFLKNEIQNFGIYHATNAGTCSWYEFAHYFLNKIGFTNKIDEITADEFQSAVKYPSYSVLSNEKTNAIILRPTWQMATDHYLNAMGYQFENKALTNSLALNTSKSSTDSPTPT